MINAVPREEVVPVARGMPDYRVPNSAHPAVLEPRPDLLRVHRIDDPESQSGLHSQGDASIDMVVGEAVPVLPSPTLQ